MQQLAFKASVVDWFQNFSDAELPPIVQALARLQKWMFDDDHLKDYFDIRRLCRHRHS